MRIQPHFIDSFSTIARDGNYRIGYCLWNIPPLYLIEMEDTDGWYSWNVYDDHDETMRIWKQLKEI